MAKLSRSKNVSPLDRRSDANLSRGMYRPLDRRKPGNEPVFFRLHNSKRRSNVVDGKVKPAKSLKEASYDLRELPCSEFERGYMV